MFWCYSNNKCNENNMINDTTTGFPGCCPWHGVNVKYSIMLIFPLYLSLGAAVLTVPRSLVSSEESPARVVQGVGLDWPTEAGGSTRTPGTGSRANSVVAVPVIHAGPQSGHPVDGGGAPLVLVLYSFTPGGVVVAPRAPAHPSGATSPHGSGDISSHGHGSSENTSPHGRGSSGGTSPHDSGGGSTPANSSADPDPVESENLPGDSGSGGGLQGPGQPLAPASPTVPEEQGRGGLQSGTSGDSWPAHRMPAYVVSAVCFSLVGVFLVVGLVLLCVRGFRARAGTGPTLSARSGARGGRDRRGSWGGNQRARSKDREVAKKGDDVWSGCNNI